jgi:PRTase ComF-like
MVRNSGITCSLHQITGYPLDLNLEIYQGYPFYKLGVSASVQYYAERLAPLVSKIMTNNQNYTDWVITSPRFHQLPAAANLLCWAVYEKLKRQNDSSRNISLINFQKAGYMLQTAGDFSNYNDYSKYSWEKRLKVKSKHDFIINEEDFSNRGIVFINDINVTGASQEYIRQVFEKVYPDTINWLYIINCDELTGRKEPQLESELNNFKIKTVYDFGAILARDELRYSAKCISKIFTYSTEDLEKLMDMLNSSQKSKIWDAILIDDLYHGDFFKEKMAMLMKICQ